MLGSCTQCNYPALPSSNAVTKSSHSMVGNKSLASKCLKALLITFSLRIFFLRHMITPNFKNLKLTFLGSRRKVLWLIPAVRGTQEDSAVGLTQQRRKFRAGR